MNDTRQFPRQPRMAVGRLRKFVLIGAVLLAAYAAPFLLLRQADAAATACSPNCGTYYAGQLTPSATYVGIRGYIAFPSTTMQDPTNDGLLHWVGLTNTSFSPIEWLQFGAWNGFGNGGTGTSSYNWYGEFKSWCNGYSYSTYGSTASSSGRLHVNYYTGESYSCGGVATVYKIIGWTLNSLYSKSTWVRNSAARGDANDELKFGTYFEPLGGTGCYGAGLSGGSCTNNASERLQRKSGSTWSDWTGSATVVETSSSRYWHTQLSNYYRFKIDGAY